MLIRIRGSWPVLGVVTMRRLLVSMAMSFEDLS